MIRYDHRLRRFNAIACLFVIDEALVRLSRRLDRIDARGLEVPNLRDELTDRINTALDERLRLMRIRDVALAKLENLKR
jgi:hypothetical protein